MSRFVLLILGAGLIFSASFLTSSQSMALAFGYLLLAIILFRLMEKRNAARITEQLELQKQAYQKELTDQSRAECNRLMASLSQVLLVSHRQVETVRQQTEEAINQLAARFSGLVDKLNTAVLASDEAASGGGSRTRVLYKYSIRGVKTSANWSTV